LGNEIYVFSFSEKEIENPLEEWLKKLQLDKLKEPLMAKNILTLEDLRKLKDHNIEEVFYEEIILSYSIN
jgi:hypothetical protein